MLDKAAKDLLPGDEIATTDGWLPVSAVSRGWLPASVIVEWRGGWACVPRSQRVCVMSH